MFETIFVLGLMLVGVMCVVACSDKLDVQQVYEFDMATLPVQNKIVVGEEAEIRCELIRSGVYQETKYHIRYFQPEGKGQLRLEMVLYCYLMTFTHWKRKGFVYIINL